MNFGVYIEGSDALDLKERFMNEVVQSTKLRGVEFKDLSSRDRVDDDVELEPPYAEPAMTVVLDGNVGAALASPALEWMRALAQTGGDSAARVMIEVFSRGKPGYRLFEGDRLAGIDAAERYLARCEGR